MNLNFGAEKLKSYRTYVLEHLFIFRQNITKFSHSTAFDRTYVHFKRLHDKIRQHFRYLLIIEGSVSRETFEITYISY